MTMIDQIHQDMLAARKSGTAVEKSLLVTLYAEAARVGKDKRNGASTDEEVIATVRKFMGNTEETRGHLLKRGADTAAQDQELEILARYMPTQMTEQDLRGKVSEICQRLGAEGPKAMGAVMAELKREAGGRYDGKLASQVVQTHLEGNK